MRAHHVIESLHVDGGNFFRDIHLDFADGLNCLIGETGVGKSGVLLAIRYALGAPAPGELAKRYDDYIRDTLGGGEITVRVRTQNGVRYTCRRRYGDSPRVYDEAGGVAQVSLDGDLFKIDAYGQGTLEGIARSPAAQLALLDKFAEEETRRIAHEIANIDRALAQNDAERRRLTGEIEAEGASVADLPSVAEAIKALAIAGGADAVATERANARKIARGNERVAMKEVASAIAGARSGLDAYASAVTERIAASARGAFDATEGGDLVRKAHEAARAASTVLASSGEKIREALAIAADAIAEIGGALGAVHTTEDDAYQALVRKNDADRAQTEQRERLHRKLEQLSAAAKRIDDRQRELDGKGGERARLLEARGALLRERLATRERISGEISVALRGIIRVRVEEAADDTAYLALLTEMLKGANIRPPAVIADITANIRPAELVALVEADDPGPIEQANGSRAPNAARAEKILTTLRASERLGELETVVVGDLPRIELRVKGNYLPSNKVSEGQRCTCILPIILLQSAAPLLIDQAEDQLDNAYVYEVLVKSLARVKLERQLIIVTHNANIPVLGDAEVSFLLNADDGVGRVAEKGTVDEMRGWLEGLLDGGSEAFSRRGKRYGYRIER